MERRRRRERFPLSLAFDVFGGGRYLGRFWSRDVSQEGLFLMAADPDCLSGTILSLRFRADGVEHRLRGTAIRRVQGQGVGIALAFWRHGDDDAYAAYRKLLQPGPRTG
jgi:hypothetical protein